MDNLSLPKSYDEENLSTSKKEAIYGVVTGLCMCSFISVMLLSVV